MIHGQKNIKLNVPAIYTGDLLGRRAYSYAWQNCDSVKKILRLL